MKTQSIIPVFSGTINSQSVQLVNARELHQFLEVGKDFSNWIKDRIAKYKFIANQDFLILAKNGERTSRGLQPIEYHLTTDMAKELGMIERSDKGRQIRRYFIEIERQVLSPTAPVSRVVYNELLAEHEVLKAKYVNVLEVAYSAQGQLLALPKPTKHGRYSRHEINTMIEMRRNGKGPTEIARRLNRTLYGIQGKLRQLEEKYGYNMANYTVDMFDREAA